MVGDGVLFLVVPKGFLPSEDTGQLLAHTEGPEDMSFEAMVTRQQQVAEIVAQDENVDAFMSHASAPAARGDGRTTARIFIRLKPRDERKLDADQVIQRAAAQDRRGAGHPGVLPEPAADPDRRAGRRKSQYQFTLQGPDLDELYAVVPTLKERHARRCRSSRT